VDCGEGLFFDCLSKFGEVEGVEANPSLATKDSRWKHRIHVSDFDAFQANKQALLYRLSVLEQTVFSTVSLPFGNSLLAVCGKQ